MRKQFYLILCLVVVFCLSQSPDHREKNQSQNIATSISNKGIKRRELKRKRFVQIDSFLYRT